MLVGCNRYDAQSVPYTMTRRICLYRHACDKTKDCGQRPHFQVAIRIPSCPFISCLFNALSCIS